MRSRMTNGHHRSAVATKLKQNLSDGFISDLVPLSSRESWLSYFYFTSHNLAISMWMWLNKPPVIKMLRDHPRNSLVRLKLTHRQTAAAIARAKELGVSMTALLTSSGAVALAPFTALESHHRSMFRVGFNWRKWLRLPFSWLFTKSTSTISAIHPKHVPLLVGLSVDARPALGLTSYLNGSFNTIMVATMPRTPLLPPLLSSSKSLFHATAAGAQKLTRDLRQATLPNGIGYAWRYATLLPVNYSHPDSQSLRTWWQPSAKGRALDIHSSNIHLPLCLGISNLGRVEMEDAKSAIGKDDTWVKEIWLVSTVRAVSSWGMLQWNTITLDGIMYVVIASAEGCFEKDTVIEISNRFGMALCGEKVEVVSS
ncbi:hypothetical protein BC829DRAFT_385069 [Chytridium lagenaria]|nr:hypothetical protein BC829DRAFT_385069 [Chytridium lagenaria]